jgi:hypothetical protein
MNDIQDQIISLNADRVIDLNIRNKSGFFVYDDFVGSAVDEYLWGLSGNNAEHIAADAGYPNMGSLQLAVVNDTGNIGTVALAVGTNDFVFATSVRTVTKPGTGEFFTGLFSPTDAKKCYFIWDGASPNWFANIANTTHDLIIPAIAQYQKLWIVRTGGVVSFYIDGTLLHSEAFATDLDNAVLFAQVDSTGTAQTMSDYMKLWVDRA